MHELLQAKFIHKGPSLNLLVLPALALIVLSLRPQAFATQPTKRALDLRLPDSLSWSAEDFVVPPDNFVDLLPAISSDHEGTPWVIWERRQEGGGTFHWTGVAGRDHFGVPPKEWTSWTHMMPSVHDSFLMKATQHG